MLLTKMNFSCPLCKNEDFYIMPLEEKINQDFVYRDNKYKLMCKKCGQLYLFEFTIKTFIREEI